MINFLVRNIKMLFTYIREVRGSIEKVTWTIFVLINGNSTRDSSEQLIQFPYLDLR